LNAGSSSLKFAVYDANAALALRLAGQIDEHAGAKRLAARGPDGAILIQKDWPADSGPSHGETVGLLLDSIAAQLRGLTFAAVGHRIVQGGADHIRPEIVTPALVDALQALTILDPLHMPQALETIHAVSAARPGLAQAVCYDTAFHHTLPLEARRFALPRELEAEGVRRYGFHGLSCEYISGHLSRSAPGLARGRVIVAHLGSGASLCALQGGKSIATTTGFSALEGLMMASRCGSLDPGVLLYLGRQGRSFEDLEDLLYRRSGLLGVSGISADLRVLLASKDPYAQEAVDLFTYRIAIEAGAMVSALGGLDGFVFTAGIGEHAPVIRQTVCERLAWLGIVLDQAENAAGAYRISAPDSKIEVLVIATDEEAMIARHTLAATTGAPAND
jgi:acetate kinase